MGVEEEEDNKEFRDNFMTNETIKQRIQRKRGLYERKRRKRFLKAKHLNQINNYYRKKQPKAIIEPRPVVKELKLKWWQKLLKVDK